MYLDVNKVAFDVVGQNCYPKIAFYHPPENYPEHNSRSLDPQNEIYPAIRNLLYRLNLDRYNFGTKEWSPFRDLIRPGMTVFIKPNTVSHKHTDHKEIFSVITHGSILRPILDYVCKALKGAGKIIIGDSQSLFSDFDKAMDVSKIGELVEWYRNQTKIPIECIDLRLHKGVRTYLYGKWGRKAVKQDSKGYRFVDLGDFSYFKGVDPARLRIAIADHRSMYKHHSNGRHQYLYPKSFLESDVVISIPKLKTHRRTAVTLALKNFIGIPSLKDTLPHYKTGSFDEGGDQYIHFSFRKKICTALHDKIQSNPHIPVKALLAIVKKLIWNSHKFVSFKDEIYEGMWHGNDTLWRTLLDLSKASLFADKDGKLRRTQQRTFFCVVDGIVAGEKNGPLSPDPVMPGILIAGFNPVAIDAVGATLMGFDIEKIPLIKKAMQEKLDCMKLFSGEKQNIRIVGDSKEYNLSELSHKKKKSYLNLIRTGKDMLKCCIK